MTDIFHEIPGNPPPENAAGGYFHGPRRPQAALRALSRRRRARCKGTVIILPGRNECIEKYFETIREPRRARLHVGDLRLARPGRLRPAAARPAARPCRELPATMSRISTSFFEEVVLPDCRGPYYVLAHSTGSLIALLATPSLVNRVRRMVLIAPFLTYTGFPLSMPTIRRIAGVLYWLGLGRMYGAWGARPRRSPPFATNKLTTDIGRYRRNMEIYETYPATGARRPDRRLDPRRLPGGRHGREPGLHAADHHPDAVHRRGHRRGRLDAGDRGLCQAPARRLAPDHRRRAPRTAAGGRHLPRAVAGGLRRLHSRQRRGRL